MIQTMNELTFLLHTYANMPKRETETQLGRCKMSAEEAKEIKQRHERGEPLRAIARHYGCCHRTVMNVVRGHCGYGTRSRNADAPVHPANPCRIGR